MIEPSSYTSTDLFNALEPTSILGEPPPYLDLTDEDRRLLVKIVEEQDSTIKEILRAICAGYMRSGKQIDQFDSDDMINDLMTTGLLNGKNNPLYDPEHKKWSDTQICDKTLQYTIGGYLLIKYMLGENESKEHFTEALEQYFGKNYFPETPHKC
jgi:hypothetical protein